MKRHDYAGFSLIELLVSLLLLSIGLLSLLAIQIKVLRDIQASFLYSLASQQLQNLANQTLFLHQDDLLSQVLTTWRQENKQVLPNGKSGLLHPNKHAQAFIQWHTHELGSHARKRESAQRVLLLTIQQ